MCKCCRNWIANSVSSVVINRGPLHVYASFNDDLFFNLPQVIDHSVYFQSVDLLFGYDPSLQANFLLTFKISLEGSQILLEINWLIS